MSAFDKVEELREMLKKKYPSLECTPEKTKNIRLKALSVEPSIVRPTIKSNEVASMLQYSSKHKNIKDVNYGPLPKRPLPLIVKAQQYEAETSLDCFMKHIATKSFEKYVMERIPGFRKKDLVEISLVDLKKKPKKKFKNRGMNLENLEIFGQIQVKSKSPTFQSRNLKIVEKGIKRSVRSWCLQESKKIDLKSQLIDHFTFKYKRMGDM
jgi:hypothetical protein